MPQDGLIQVATHIPILDDMLCAQLAFAGQLSRTGSGTHADNDRDIKRIETENQQKDKLWSGRRQGTDLWIKIDTTHCHIE